MNGRSERVVRTLRRILRHDGGVAMVEFALCLPFVVGLTMAGAELANYTTTKMRVSQLALMVADNASRIGAGSTLNAKTISEAQINDLLAGAGLQGGRLNLFQHGRVIVSSLQPTTNPSQYAIKWQRCRGVKAATSTYGDVGEQTSGITANGQLITAPSDGAVMFVEINYSYQPLVSSAFVPHSEIREIAAMTVRDNRDYTGGTDGIYNAEGVTASDCSTYSAS
ncbi:MAG: TadE/TadG family type IV pilus assembly protein [Sphingobium sp.]